MRSKLSKLEHVRGSPYTVKAGMSGLGQGPLWNPPRTDRLTDITENITLPQLSLLLVISQAHI